MSTARKVSPLIFVTVLYFMQALPVALVRETMTVVYKSLGEENEPIARLTALAALPWALQFLLGPVVELTSTRRRWVTNTQIAMSAIFLLLPFTLQLPNAFEISLGFLFIAAVFSVLGNVAQDGLYLMILDKDEQAKYAGVLTTASRLGRLFVTGLIVLLAGRLMQGPPMELRVSQGQLTFKAGKTVNQSPNATIKVQAANLAGQVEAKDVRGGTYIKELGNLEPPIHVPPHVRALEIRPNGLVMGDGQRLGQIAVPPGASLSGTLTSTAPTSRVMGWTVALLLCGIVFAIGTFINRKTIPYPPEDVPAEGEAGPEIQRTLVIVGAALAGYFAVNAVVRLMAHVAHFRSPETLKGWKLPDPQQFLSFPLTGISPVLVEVIQLLICGVALAVLLRLAKRSLSGTKMADVFTSYFRQPGFAAILFFLMFYRFGEAMVASTSTLFLQDDFAKGGMALNPAQVGAIKGIVGVAGIILGGILGGLYLSKVGLKRGFLVVALCMHIPIILYIWAAAVQPDWRWIFLVDFVDQFGYGFGYAGYGIYLMRVAARGHNKTAHYAIGIGIGAMFISVAGIVAGKFQEQAELLAPGKGWMWFFVFAAVMAIPGLISLFMVPKDVAEG